MRTPIDELVDRLGIQVRDPSFIGLALVHSSYYNENPALVPGHNERLEFLGDALVGLVVSDLLFERYPDDDEGLLSARRAALVNRTALAAIALELELDRYLLLGRGESQGGVRARPSVLAAAFEALAGAVYLGSGTDTVSAWLRPIFEKRIGAGGEADAVAKPAKSLLQEWTQRTQRLKPRYEVLDATGPSYEQWFTVAATVAGRRVGVGEGSSRRAAEEEAARAALGLLAAEASPELSGKADAEAGVEEA